MRNNVEHYVVKPSTPAYDWPYEYSTPSTNTGCKCNIDSEKLSKDINNLRSALSNLLNTVSNISSIDMNSEELAEIINNAIDQYLNTADDVNKVVQIVDGRVQNQYGIADSSYVPNMKSDVDLLKETVNSLTSLLDDTNKIALLLNQLSTLQNTINSLSGIIENTNSTLNSHVDNTDIHVSALDKLRWNTAAENSMTSVEYAFEVNSNVLSLKKTIA